ncbi:MAG TPA: carbon-nitrogen hydrolase family protein [Candidatus Glassbacteria bacterium]|nr:carbon-nitrogen hydrolase family protein [Candidatus Glassbacteria bacterium]
MKDNIIFRTCFKKFPAVLIWILAAAGLVFNHGALAMEKVKVAIAQTRCTDSDLNGNLEKIAEKVEKAAAEGAKMVFFPETADLGWVNPDAHRLAGPVPGGGASDRICNLARQHEIWIGVGLCEKDGDKLYDTAILVNPQGEIALKHRKINLLAWLMDPPYTPGRPEDIKAVATPFGRVGVLICADSFEDELLENMRVQKPDLVFIPYGWAAKQPEWPEHSFSLVKTVQKAARTIGAPVIGPNVVGRITHGPWTDYTYEGLSTAADANGMSLVQGRWNTDDLLVFEVEPGNIQ